MALPKLNAEFQYEMVIPSTKKPVSFRPYLVKEEKILLMASESKDNREMMKAMKTVIEACFDCINVKSLTLFDIEQCFIQLRARSAGEETEVGYVCSNEECKTQNRVKINLLDIDVDFPKASKNRKIDLSGDIQVELRYPRLDDADIKDTESVEAVFDVIDSIIERVYTDTECIDFQDEPREDRLEFIESLNNAQFEKIRSFIENLPSTKLDIEFDCEHCGTKNTAELKGIQNFFG